MNEKMCYNCKHWLYNEKVAIKNFKKGIETLFKCNININQYTFDSYYCELWEFINRYPSVDLLNTASKDVSPRRGGQQWYICIPFLRSYF